MIRPLRRAHRRVFWILAVLLPLLYALALLGREEPAPRGGAPAGIFREEASR